jgi:hypothetical protein
MGIFPHHSPGTFTCHVVQGVLHFEATSLHRLLPWEPYLRTQESTRLFGTSLDHGCQWRKKGAVVGACTAGRQQRITEAWTA